MMKLLLLALLIATLALTAVEAATRCPIDNSSAYFTGTTKTDNQTGKQLWLYKCARDHSFWVVR